jgi:protein LSM14
MSSIPYLGSKISLLSMSDIRYEGILVDVSPADSTITFEKVRFFGTEGRRPGNEIGPMDKVFPLVVFRSTDVKDLQVYETAADLAKTTESEIPDPAVVSATFPGASANAQDTPSRNRTSGFQYQSRASTAAADAPVVSMPSKPLSFASAATSQQHHGSQAGHSHDRGHGQQHSQPQQFRRPSQQQQQAKVVVPNAEYDFSSANAKFQKSEDDMNAAAGQTDPAYNKSSSFFDNISCQANDQPMERRERMQHERDLNMETFGQAAPARRYGRGRGGYHRGSGRGGSGFNRSNYFGNASRPSDA